MLRDIWNLFTTATTNTPAVPSLSTYAGLLLGGTDLVQALVVRIFRVGRFSVDIDTRQGSDINV